MQSTVIFSKLYSVCRFINNFLSNLSIVNHPLRYLNLSRTVINHKLKVLMKDILQTIYLKFNPTLLVHILICLHFPAFYIQNPLLRTEQQRKQKPQKSKSTKSCRSVKLLNKLKNKSLIQLTSTSSQASTGSSTPESFISLSLVQAPEALTQCLT